MFSSGSENERSPRREFSRGLSLATSALGDHEGTVGPGLSPLRHAALLVSSQIPGMSERIGAFTPNLGVGLGGSSQKQHKQQQGSSNADQAMELMTPSSPEIRTEASFRNAEPPKSIPDTEARRSKARSHSRRSSPMAVVIGGAQDEGFLKIGQHRNGVRATMVATAAAENHLTEFADQSLMANESRRSALRRRNSSIDDVSSSIMRRPDIPPPHRVLPAKDGRSGREGGGGGWEEGGNLSTTHQDPNVGELSNGSSSTPPAGVAPTPQYSDMGSSSYASGSGPTLSEGAISSSDFSSRGPSASAYDDSVFDSASTWAGASAISLTSNNTQSVFKTPGRDSMLDATPLSAVSEHNVELITTATTDHASGGSVVVGGGTGDGGGGGGWTLTDNGWAKLPLTDNSNNRTPGYGGRGRKPSPAHGPSGTAPRRNSQRWRLDRENSWLSNVSGGGSANPLSKPRHLSLPTSTPRRAAMSPHGPAMDAALRMIEDGGMRLGIVKEEGADEKGARDVAYDKQIAVPQITSLEQRRQRAKAWAKSRLDLFLC